MRIPLRTSHTPNVEALERRITELVALRQELRSAGADADELERNRVEIARLQRDLSTALIDRYLPSRRAA